MVMKGKRGDTRTWLLTLIVVLLAAGLIAYGIYYYYYRVPEDIKKNIPDIEWEAAIASCKGICQGGFSLYGFCCQERLGEYKKKCYEEPLWTEIKSVCSGDYNSDGCGGYVCSLVTDEDGDGCAVEEDSDDNDPEVC